MTTIPLKDGAPDWKQLRLTRECDGVLLPGGPLWSPFPFGRACYIAALERCAEWHETKAKPWDNSNTADVDHRNGKSTAHKESAAVIRQWIEKEKANG